MEKNRQQSLRQNLIFNVIYQVVVILSPLVVTPKFSRVMGADYVGLKSFTFSIVYYFAIIGALGLEMYGQRRIAIAKDDKEERSRIFFSISLVKIICGLISMTAYIFAFIIFNSDPTMRILYLCWTIYLFRELINPVWYLQGVERFRLACTANIFSQIAYVLCVFLFINTKEDLDLYIIFYTAIPLAMAIFFWPIILKDVQPVRLYKKEMLDIIKESFVYFVPTIATALYSMIDKTMLGIFDMSKISAGYYEQAEKLVKIALAFATALYTIVRTRMSYVFKNKTRDEYKSYSELFISLSMFLCWPILFGIVGIAKDFVPLFFGDDYTAVTGLIYVFVWIIPCLSISGLLQAIYIFPQGLQNIMNRYYVMVLCVNFVLNISLIPWLDAYGAVIASICAELLLAVVMLRKSRSDIEIKMFFLKSIRYFISGVLMTVVMWLVSLIETATIYKVCLEFICGCGTYFIMCVILRDPFVIAQIKKVKGMLIKDKKS